MSLLYSPGSFNYTDSEMKNTNKVPEFGYHQQQEQHHDSDPFHFRSEKIPSMESLFNNGGHGSEEYRCFRTSSPEIDEMWSRLSFPGKGSSLYYSNSNDLQEYQDRLVIKQEIDDSEFAYGSLPLHGTCNRTFTDDSVNDTNPSATNGSNLFRANTSLGGNFSGFVVQNGFSITRNQTTNSSYPRHNFSRRQLVSKFTNDIHTDGVKRSWMNERNMFPGSNTLTSQLQSLVVPCKIRAKRGFATHPRSIAERIRRTRISERMRKLQELFPHMDKQTNTADMLDLAVEYIKDLKEHVQILTDAKEKCTC